jgi:hypothetical protein
MVLFHFQRKKRFRERLTNAPTAAEFIAFLLLSCVDVGEFFHLKKSERRYLYGAEAFFLRLIKASLPTNLHVVCRIRTMTLGT